MEAVVKSLESIQPLDPRVLMMQLMLSLLLGMLVGLQRERTKARFGMRTFALITILGTSCALLSTQFGFWILSAGLFCLIFVAISSIAFSLYNRSLIQRDITSKSIQDVPLEFGTTTLVTTLVMYCVGAMLANPKWTLIALEIGGITAVLLQFKLELHHIAALFGEEDMRAIMQFVMITFVILPVLPNSNYGPYNSFNPFEIWLMVVLIVGMSLSGYIAYKFFGERAGLFLSGILGGIISSTATAVCYSKQVATQATSKRVAALVIVISSAFLMIRTLVIIGIISPKFLSNCIFPLIIFTLISFVPFFVLNFMVKRESSFKMAEQTNPTQWSSALSFAILYAIISFGMNAGSHLFGGEGLYWIAAISGFTETSAITISTARLALTEGPVMESGWQLIMVATMSNYLFKWIMVLLLAGWKFGLEILCLFSFPLVGGVLLLLLL